MKSKLSIVLAILLAIAITVAVVFVILFMKNNSELNKQKQLSANQKKQIKELKDRIVSKDKEIAELKGQIEGLNKVIDDEKAKAIKLRKKQKANKVAENGDYESEDTTEIFETEDQPPEGTFRTLTVSSSSDKSITLKLEESESGGRRIDGFQEPVSVSLKNGSGTFKAVYGGGNYGSETITFDGTINIVDKKTISITCNNGKGWRKGTTHTFKKK